jgi:hypothetical protein
MNDFGKAIINGMNQYSKNLADGFGGLPANATAK